MKWQEEASWAWSLFSGSMVVETSGFWGQLCVGESWCSEPNRWPSCPCPRGSGPSLGQFWIEFLSYFFWHSLLVIILNMVYTCTLWMISTGKLNNTSITSHSNFFLWWEHLRSTLLANFRIQHSVANCNQHAMHWIPGTWHLTAESFTL